MSKWEYRILEIEKVSSRLELLSLDNDRIETDKRTPDLFYAEHGFNLYAYLNAAGQEGWEMVGCSPAERTVEEQNFIEFLIFLKRPT